MRIGFGFDIHRFDFGRQLVLGAVNIEGSPGLAGHSDADVLLHAIADALLGAGGKGDIGELFPDTNLLYKNIKSTILLERVYKLIKPDWLIENIDVTLICEKPRIAPYKEVMRDNIAKVLDIDKMRINIKATTAEGMGCLGRSEGIAAYAVALLKERL